jgi:hypothetical protein
MLGHKEVQGRFPLSAPNLGIFTTFVLPLVGESWIASAIWEGENSQRGNIWSVCSDLLNLTIPKSLV